jgi:hypothetical protein
MKISKDNRKRIEDEFDFVIKKMVGSKSPDLMMYYFSGIHTNLNRIANLSYSDDLIFVFFILEKVHRDVTTQLSAYRQGNPAITFNEKFGKKFIEATIELKEAFFDAQKRIDALKKLVIVSYTTTGNGRFLTEKGVIDIFSK